jgi:hypothetical protein
MNFSLSRKRKKVIVTDYNDGRDNDFQQIWGLDEVKLEAKILNFIPVVIRTVVISFHLLLEKGHWIP